MTAIYTHRILGTTYELAGEDMDIKKAWNLFEFACNRMGWNPIVSDIHVAVK